MSTTAVRHLVVRLFRSGLVIILSWAAVNFGCLTPILAATAFEEGLENFNQHRYNTAADCFQRALKTRPNDARLHFFLGQCFEHLLDPDSAKAEYELAFRLNPFDEQGKRARQAMLDLAGQEAVRAMGPIDTPEMYRQCLDIINRQTNDLKARSLRDGFRHSQRSLSIGESEAGRRGYTGALRGSFAGEISDRSEIASSYWRYDSLRESAKHRELATHRAFEAERCSNNLKELLADHSNHGTNPKLRALGTNLYVRNYRNNDFDLLAPPQDPVVELRAKDKSLFDSKMPGDMPTFSIRSLHLWDEGK